MERLTVPRPWWLLPVGRVNPVWWFAFAGVLTAIDASGGALVDYPAVYFIPTVFAAWYSGRRTALGLVAVVTSVQLVELGMTPDVAWLLPLGMTILRAVVISFMAIWFARLEQYERQVERYVGELEGLLPICAFCKSIRDESGSWEKLERYISARSRADFSHSVCPDCRHAHYPGT